MNKNYYRETTAKNYSYVWKNRYAKEKVNPFIRINDYSEISSYINNSNVNLDLNYIKLSKIELSEDYMVIPVYDQFADFFSVGFAFLFLMALLIPSLGIKDNDSIPLIVFIIIFILMAFIIFNVVYFFTRPKKELIFDRKNGLITFPDYRWNSNNTMPFKEVIFGQWSNYSTYTSPSMRLSALVIPSPKIKKYAFLFHFTDHFEKGVSLLMWYMDRNRPLPPGTAFDDFREKDFNRRKQEKFPLPLVESNFEIREHTEIQQNERDKFWLVNQLYKGMPVDYSHLELLKLAEKKKHSQKKRRGKRN